MDEFRKKVMNELGITGIHHTGSYYGNGNTKHEITFISTDPNLFESILNRLYVAELGKVSTLNTAAAKMRLASEAVIDCGSPNWLSEKIKALENVVEEFDKAGKGAGHD